MIMRRALGVFVLMAVCAGASAAHAEWAIDLFGGAAWTQSTDLSVKGIDDSRVNVNATLSDIDVDTGLTVGLRIGYWFESTPILGLALDTFFFSMPVPAQTVDTTATFTGSILDKPFTFTSSGQARVPSIELPGLAFSPQLNLRWPLLVSAEFPKGRLQPYLGAGPAWAFSVDTDELSIVTGGLVRTGMSFQLLRFIGVFAEYRYSFFPDFQLSNNDLTFKADLNTHNFVGGLSFRF
jgi:opacity protein-like surface antigen